MRYLPDMILKPLQNTFTPDDTTSDKHDKNLLFSFKGKCYRKYLIQ